MESMDDNSFSKISFGLFIILVGGLLLWWIISSLDIDQESEKIVGTEDVVLPNNHI